jgi:hypothetical protein
VLLQLGETPFSGDGGHYLAISTGMSLYAAAPDIAQRYYSTKFLFLLTIRTFITII